MIVIYGATGFAGGLIARGLADRGTELRLVGRDRRRLDSLAETLPGSPEVRVAAVHDQRRLAAAFDGASVVIGCAGPFSRLGAPIIEAAIAASCHYVDIGNEQPFLRNIYERFESAAHRAGVVCVSGLGFRIAIGDWAAALAHASLGDGGGSSAARSPDEPVDEISVAYAIRKPRLTTRERASAAVALSSPTVIWKSDRWQTVAPGSERRRFSFGDEFADATPNASPEKEAVLFGGGEAITVPRHVAAREVKTYLWLDTGNPLIWETTRLAPILSPVLGPLIAGPLSRFVRAQAEASASPGRAADRQQTSFAIVATATSGFETKRVAVRGRDPYGLSAEICSAGALALANRRTETGGVLTPAQVFDPRARLYSLATRELIEVDES